MERIMELTEMDNEESARQIEKGMTSGILDSEDYRVAWSLTTNKFEH